MDSNRIHPDDIVAVTVYDDGQKVTEYTDRGYHTVADAIRLTLEHDHEILTTNPADYVYNVYNCTTEKSSNYRINAGGNVRLIAGEI